MNRQSENTEIDAILFDDGYLLLSDNVGKLPINLLMDRVGIIIIGAIKGMMPLDIDRNGVRVSAKETMRIVWMIEKCTTAGGVCIKYAHSFPWQEGNYNFYSTMKT